MKGTFYKTELVVFAITDEDVLNKYNKLKASGELEVYVNKIFAESVLHSSEKKQMENFDQLKDAYNQQFTELSKKIDFLQNSLANNLTNGVNNNNLSHPSIQHKEVVSSPSAIKDSNIMESMSPSDVTAEEKVNTGSLIKKGNKKKNLNMATLLGKASKMKN